jgi:hypothetical protein
MLQPPKEEALALVLNVSRKRVALGCSQLSSSTKTCKNPTKTQLPRAMTFKEINCMPPLKMGIASYQWIRKAWRHCNEHKPKKL